MGPRFTRAWFNLWSQNYPSPQTVEPEAGFDLALPGVQVVDCNGDRLPDVAHIQPGAVRAAPGAMSAYVHFFLRQTGYKQYSS